MILRDFGIAFGAIMLAVGVCSPAAGSVNNHASSLVFLGLALVVSVLWADYKTDRHR